MVRAGEALEGGINRNSNPQAITTARNVFDRFLAKFPLLFGYWKKYADLEFSITGTEAADMVGFFRANNRKRFPPLTHSFRSMNEVLPVSHLRSIYGPTTVPSKRRLPTTPTLFESEYISAGFSFYPLPPFPLLVTNHYTTQRPRYGGAKYARYAPLAIVPSMMMG